MGEFAHLSISQEGCFKSETETEYFQRRTTQAINILEIDHMLVWAALSRLSISLMEKDKL